MEDIPRENNSAMERAKKFVSDLAKRVKSSDSKVHETLTTKAVGSDQITDTRAPHLVIDATTMPIFSQEDELFSIPIHESVEVPEFVPAMALENSLDLTYVTELDESGFSGYETDARKLNSTDEKLDGDYSAMHYDDQFCSFSCISPASFNLNPTSSLYADRCIAETYVDDGRSWSQPHFVIDDIITPIFFEEDEHFSFPIHESVEVPEFVSAMTLENSLDLTCVTELIKSGFPGYKTDAGERLSLNSTNEKLDSDYSTMHYVDQFCSFSCISPASFNLNPTSSLYADRCIADTCVDDGRSWSQQSCSSDELDSFFDVSVLQNEQCSTYVKRTVV